MSLTGDEGAISTGRSQKSPFVVLGVALVVDQLGKGARMVLRYPTAPAYDGAEDLFFRLPSRQVAKLFRLRPALCGQPMTLSVGGTVFCCCATLMGGVGGGDDDSTTNYNDSTDTTHHTEEDTSGETKENLALFSVIVALAPQSQTYLIPLSGWAEDKGAPSSSEADRAEKLSVARSLSMLEGKLGAPKDEGSRASASFLSIRRVHISLARLCRVLEREERRCRYVSLQSDRFRKIRSEAQKIWKDQQFSKTLSSTPGTSAVNSPGSIQVPKPASAASERKRGHRKVASFGRGEMNVIDRSVNISNQAGDDIIAEIEQEVMESIMAAKPYTLENSTAVPFACDHSGNLARELAQVYHALGRNDLDFPPSPSDLLTGKSGIVYVNRHIAVAMEALSPNRGVLDDSKPVVYPYHTLLYPQASPSELLDSLKMTGPGAPRRLQQFLLMANPQKSLKDIAVDANLPLQKAIEIASYLVGQGVCMASPVVSRSSRLVCTSVDSIRELRLAFSQTFGPTINLFAVVSFLTLSGRSLGESMTALTTLSDPIVTVLRQSMEVSLEQNAPLSRPRMATNSFALSPSALYGDVGPTVAQEELQRIEELEELLYQMATWLRSRRALNHLIDFVVARAHLEPTRNVPRKSDASEPVEEKVDRSSGGHGTSEDAFLRELSDLDCLGGHSSLHYCSWRLGLEPSRFRALVARCTQLRFVSREPAEGDDW